MSEGKLPVAVKSSSFRLFGVEVRCHVLDNGQRVIEEECLHQLLGTMGNVLIDAGDELEGFSSWLRG